MYTLPIKNFPLLKHIPDAPTKLYFKGNQKLISLSRKIAVVGTRHPTPYGRQQVQKLVKFLAKNNFCIASGLMYGIDEIAILTALKYQAPVIGIWAGGLSKTSLSKRYPLAQKIINQKGLLLSEYKPSYIPKHKDFLARNRIVVGISLGTLIIEGTLRSGTSSSARLTTEYNRELFAVPGPVNSLQSRLPNQLITNLSAHSLIDPQTIIEEL